MKLSAYSIEYLSLFIAGDIEGFPYRSGPDLVDFFNQFGGNDLYGSGFPTRRYYAQAKLNELNGTEILADVIAHAVDPRLFLHTETSIEEAVSGLNKVLYLDDYEVVPKRKGYTVRRMVSEKLELGDTATVSDPVTQDVIEENIDKCYEKLAQGDYTGAITNARSLVEAVLIGIEKDLDPTATSYDGDILKLFKRVQKLLNLEPGQKDISNSLRQILTGLTSIVNGLASLRNRMGDAHATTYRPSEHHAKLAVMSAATLVEFLFETRKYQEERGSLLNQQDHNNDEIE